MKKAFVFILFSAMIFLGCTHIAYAKASAEASNLPPTKDVVIMTLMQSEIQNAVNVFYEPYIDQPQVGVFLSDSRIISIKAEDGGSTFTVIVEVSPFVGAHNSIGKDRITMFIYVDGTVTVMNYEHLESHELPPNYPPKKPLP